MKSVALVVVDTQEGIFNKVMKVYQPEKLIANINRLIDVFHLNAWPVVYIRHTNNSMLKLDSKDWQIHLDLRQQDTDYFINKSVSSVFDEKHLYKLLVKLNVKSLVIVGLISHGCVKAACKGGIEHNFDTWLISDAHSNFNKKASEIIGEVNQDMAKQGVKVTTTENFLSFQDEF